MSISVKGVIKKYDTCLAVDDISFTIPEGRIVAFLGPNGAGKSTTIKIMNGYIDADAGEVEILNHRVNNTNRLKIQHFIGYLPENNPLYYDFYVKEYLEFIAETHHIKNKKQVIEEHIDLLGLRIECHKKIEQLSKGYKQRVGLAAAMLHNPKILILDEPTSGLDPNQIVEIRNLIKKIAHQKTILFSTHYLQEVELLCDDVIIISKGKILIHDSLINIKKEYQGESLEKIFNTLTN